MKNWKVIALLLATCALANACAQEKPEYATMRAHRIKMLSDADILKYHAEAKLEFEKAKEHAKAQADEFWKKKTEQLVKCNADIAYKTRNPDDCRIPATAYDLDKPLLGQESVERFFERKLMGICEYVQTVKDARKAGCLP